MNSDARAWLFTAVLKITRIAEKPSIRSQFPVITKTKNCAISRSLSFGAVERT